MAVGVCLECGAESTFRQVVGCVYADPCGHRWRGRLEEPVRLASKARPRLMPRATVATDLATGRRRIVFRRSQR